MRFAIIPLLTLYAALAAGQTTNAAAAAPAPAERRSAPNTPPVNAEWVKEFYTKHEYEIPMRDGKKMFTSVYVPKDNSRTYPIMLNRTPYSVAPYGVDQSRASLGPSDLFARAFYIFVYQDVRGRNMSEGEFVNVTPHRPAKRDPQDVDESTDTYDTIDWLLKNVRGHNGRVGMWGISYPGFYTAAGIIDAHPALKAASPQAPVTDWFIGDDFHHNGALYLPHAFNFFARFGKPRPEPVKPKATPEIFEHGTPDAYNFFLQLGPLSNVNEKHFKHQISFWNDLMKHGTYTSFWKERDVRQHMKQIAPAVLTVGGWYDAEDLFGALTLYSHIEKGVPKSYNGLVMGPWYHGQWGGRADGSSLGAIKFDANTSHFYREHIEFPFFEHYLKDKPDPKLPEAYMFETGTNQWRRFEQWPPANIKRRSLFLAPGGKLSFESPASAPQAFEEYVSDPSKPVPYINSVSIQMTREHMVDDQRFASTRPDVLVYQTEPLTDDLTIAGPVTPSLFVSTTGTDSDWVVKLIDVYPEDIPTPTDTDAPRMGGYQQLVRGEVMRGKFRNSYETPEPFTPGKITRVKYVMPDAYHTFRRGHRIMVQIQSSWFPLVDRNPQQFLDIYNARATDFRKATQRIYHGGQVASNVEINVLPR